GLRPHPSLPRYGDESVAFSNEPRCSGGGGDMGDDCIRGSPATSNTDRSSSPARRTGPRTAQLTAEVDRLDLMPSADAPSLRAVFSWSYRALPASAARVFRLLGLSDAADLSLPASSHRYWYMALTAKGQYAQDIACCGVSRDVAVN